MRSADVYTFEGIDNFRDFGGFPGRFGRLRSGRLFRSAHLAKASPADLRTLETLGLGAVADLRRFTERARAPNRLPEGFSGLLIANDAGDLAEAPHIEFLRQGDLSDEAVGKFLDAYYRQAPFEARHLDLFTRAFEALGRLDGALLVHCTAGKDRTGMLVGLIQRALGVYDDDVMGDYLATNAAVMTPARIETARRDLGAATGGEPSQAMLNGFLGVEGRHLQAAFAEIDARAGGLEPYLAQIGVSAADLERLRVLLVD